MSNLFDLAGDTEPQTRRMHGLAIAVVINNIDTLGQGRVQLELPWLPGVMPFARVAAGGGGMMAGIWWQPQIGEEVVVGFLNGETNSPIVLGSLWGAMDRPPASLPTDAVQKRIFRTPFGLQLEFDDILQSVTISTPLGQKVELTPTGVKAQSLLGGPASVELTATGEVKVTAATKIELTSAEVSINAAKVSVTAGAELALTAGGRATLKGAMVEIN